MLAGALGACAGVTRPAPPGDVPVPAQPPVPERRTVRTDTAWTRAYVPGVPVRYRLRWRSESIDGRTVQGRATATFTPPDSLWLEYRAPFGRRGEAGLVGRRVVHASPQEARALLAPWPLLWTALGVLWTPAENRVDPLGHVGADRRTWQIRIGDTLVTWVERPGPPAAVTVQVIVRDRPTGSARVELDPARRPAGGRILLRAPRRLLSFEIEGIEVLPVGGTLLPTLPGDVP